MSSLWRSASASFIVTSSILVVASNQCGISLIKGRSMQPTFNRDSASGDYAAYRRTSTCQRGDVVIMKHPFEIGSRITKRIVALEGDVVWLPEQQDVMFIPPGHVWVEGDNPAASYDSRSYGPVRQPPMQLALPS